MKVTATTTRFTAIQAAIDAVHHHHTVVENNGKEWEVKTYGRWPGIVTESVLFLGSEYLMQEPQLTYGDGFVDVDGILEIEDQIDQYRADQASLFTTMLDAARHATPSNPMTITITTGSGRSVYTLGGGLRAKLEFDGTRGAWCDVHGPYAGFRSTHDLSPVGSIIESWESRLPWLHPNFTTHQIVEWPGGVRMLMPQAYREAAPEYTGANHAALIDHFRTLFAEADIELEISEEG